LRTLKDLKDWYYPRRKDLLKKSLNIGESNIICLASFFDSHISYLESNPGNKLFLPYFKRAVMVAEILQEQKEN